MSAFAAAVCAAVLTFAGASAFAATHEGDWTVDADTQLTEDVTVTGTLTVAEGATLDLNGYALTASAVNGAGSIVDSLAAAGYERLDYIEATQTGASTGAPGGAQAQFIDTGYRHNAKTDVDIRMAYTAVNNYRVVYGARNTGNNDTQFGVWVNGGKFMRQTCQKSASTPSSGYAATVDTVYDIRISKSGANTVKLKDSDTVLYDLADGNKTDGNNVTGNDYLFSMNQSNSSTTQGSWPCACKVWFCKISEEGVLKRNFVPVLRKSDNAKGMLDLVENKFYTKKTTESADFEGPVAAHGLRLTPSAAGVASDFSGLTIGEGVSLSFAGAGKLPANLDATKFASVEIANGAAIDLNGHTLTVKGVSGTGVISDTLNDRYAFYQELTYLESTTAGKQFIDTGYIHSTKSNVHIKFRHPSYSTAHTWFSYFGGGGRDKAYSFGGWIVYTGGKFYHWKSLGTGEGSWAGSSANTDYHLFIRKSSAAGDSGNCYVANASNSGLVSGVVKASATEWPTDVTPVTAYLFGHHNLSGTLNSSYVGSRIYLCEIRDGGTADANLVRNFIPMKRRADNKPGMMDKVNDVFYTNANPDSTEDFTAGPATATTLTATAAEIAAAGTFVIDVDEGDSVNLSSLKLYGKVKLVKTGLGTLVQDAAPEFVCGIEVREGTFQTTAALSASIKVDLSIKAGATVSIACAGATSATMPATVSLEAGAKLFFDLADFSAAEFTLASGGFSFGTGATADGCLVVSNPSYGATLASATSISVTLLTAPVTAVWTGLGEAGNFDDPGNWSCYNKNGATLPNTIPDSSTLTFRLATDADWTAKGAIALGSGVTLDLNGHNLTATSITGAGIVTDTVNLGDSTFKDADGNLYVQLEYIASSGSQYIDTGYRHNANSVADMKVAITVAPGNTWYCYYGSRTSEGNQNEFAGWVYKTHHWTGVAGAKGEQTSWSFIVNEPFLVHLDGAANATCNVDGHTFTHSKALTDSGYNDVLFAGRQGGTIPFFAAKARIYYCTIKEGNTVKRDFVAAMRASDRVLGMFDKENGVFYENKGSGTFVAGPVKASGVDAAASLHVTVAENATLSLSGLATICGNVKVVKEGAGVLTLPVDGQYFVGGLEVAAGTLSMTQTAAFFVGMPITATAGGTIEVAAADGASYANDFSLAGGTLKVLASGTGNTTTASIAGTLALETGAENAQPVVSIDMTDCTSTTFQLNTTALNVGSGVTAAPGFVSLADPAAYEASIVDGTAIKVEHLTSPVTAVWTGLGEAGNFDDPGNWSCSNKNGVALSNTLPDNTTLTFRLGTDADWTAKGAIALGSGVTLDLNGNNLTAASITGAGVVIDSSNNYYTTLKDASGNFYVQLEYLASGTSTDQYNHGMEYIDTGYQHNTKTVVDMKVQMLKETGDWYCYYGARKNNPTDALGGWIHSVNHYKGVAADGFTSTKFPKNVPFLAHMEFSGTCTFGNAEDTSTYLTYTSGAGASPGINDFMFGMNNGGGRSHGMNGRIYYCIVKEKTDEEGVYTVQRDFVAAKRLSDGVLGMLDKENGVFYTNKGSGAFIAGPYATNGSATGAGELHITAAEGETAALGSMAKIVGGIKVVKEGAGAMTLPADGQYFAGGLEVAAGTLPMTQTAAFLAGTPIVATAGGTITIAASDGASYANDFTLAGGTLKVLASGSGNTTTASIAGTLSLALGADSAQPKVFVDMTDCTSGTFLLNSTALTVGEGVTAAPGFVATPDATMFEASVEDSTIKVDHLTAPVTAEWTGRGQPGNFDDPDNWSCYNKNGVALSDAVPDVSTVAMRLTADADWTVKGAVTLGAGVTLDLNGQTLAAASITGDGLVIDTSDDSVIVADDGSVYRKIQYVQATQEGANNSGSGQSDGQPKIQYVDTEYYHVGTTKVDIRVEFQDVSYSGNYGYAVYYGCRNNGDDATHQLGGWLHNSKFFYYDTSEHDGSTAYTGRIYDIRLDKGGSSYANYADGTLASTLGTGNGAGESNTYGTDYIFANNQVWNGGKYWPCKCRVYSCKVYTGDALERDFVPVLCISGAKAGQAGFWCNVTSKFYGNSGYGSLTAGPLAQGATTASELHFTVAEGQTVSLASAPAIVGNVKMVKDGAGTLTLPATGHYFSGGIEVEAGTLSLGGALAYGGAIDAAAGTTVSVPASVGSAGTSVIDFADGGVFEIAGCATANVTGAVTLGGGNISITGTFAPVAGTAACAVELAGTTTLDFTQWTGTFPVAYPALAFASGANITLKVAPASEALTTLARTRNATTGETGGYLFTWGAIPANATLTLDGGAGSKFKTELREGGVWLRAPVGFKLIVY